MSSAGRKWLGQMLAGVSILLWTAGTAWSEVVGSGQDRCFDDRQQVVCPGEDAPFFGQDAQFWHPKPSYRDNGDGTVTDTRTGLTWSKEVSNRKVTPEEAESQAGNLRLGGYEDWRFPGIKEIYSLIDFRGYTGFESGGTGMRFVPANAIPFIDTDFFDFRYGDSQEEGPAGMRSGGSPGMELGGQGQMGGSSGMGGDQGWMGGRRSGPPRGGLSLLVRV